jgi:4-diphosphocytidyl-2-C-methyl-D-erythritol kinase
MKLNLCSPAKVNLFLHIQGKRRDGYHELASLYQAVSLFDSIEITSADADSFTCNIDRLQNEQNLAVQARDLFRRKTGIDNPVSISLDKYIPAEAGLGGGSGNAATVLWGMNQIFGSPVSETALQSWSAELGSDVPFFFSKGTAYCTGRGEKVKNVGPIDPIPLTIVKPNISLSTKEVYSRLAASSPGNSKETLQRFLSGRPQFENDLESAAFALCPELEDFKNNLLALSSDVLLCGSGSSFFCVGGNNGLPVEFINRRGGDWYSSARKRLREIKDLHKLSPGI